MPITHLGVTAYDLTTPTTVITQVFPAVANDATTGITLTALADAIDGPETIVMCITANAAYIIGEISCTTIYLTGDMY